MSIQAGDLPIRSAGVAAEPDIHGVSAQSVGDVYALLADGTTVAIRGRLMLVTGHLPGGDDHAR
jgi:hypothetical protein